MRLDSAAILKQIDAVIALDGELDQRGDFDLDDSSQTAAIVALLEIVRRFAPPGSTYRQRAEEARGLHIYQERQALAGVVQALRLAYQHNYFESVQELVRADMFDDFIDMAEYLLSEGYKDPAAVMVGGVLEASLRKLCAKHSISTTTPDGKPKKASTLNDELAKAAVYGKMEQKNITAWLDLRNKAAHGEYGAYDKKQVEFYLQGVRDFLVRFPA